MEGLPAGWRVLFLTAREKAGGGALRNGLCFSSATEVDGQTRLCSVGLGRVVAYGRLPKQGRAVGLEVKP